MNTLTKSAPLGTLGLPSGDQWVRFHVEGDSISYEVTASVPDKKPSADEASSRKKPTGFVQEWGGSAKKVEGADDVWLTHINEKHVR